MRLVGEVEGDSERSSDAYACNPRMHSLLQGCDLRRRLVGMEATPIFQQLGPMECSPFHHEGQPR